MALDSAKLEVINLGLLDYQECAKLQKAMVQERIADAIPDRLLLVSHPPTITIGKAGTHVDLYHSEVSLRSQGINVYHSDRGGKATYHGPGQLIAYPILKLAKRDVHQYVQTLLNVTASVLIENDLQPELRPGMPGVWINGGKIASIGVALKKWVTSHGVALNVNTELTGFALISPCGIPGQLITSMHLEKGGEQDMRQLSDRFVRHFSKAFGFADAERRPPWLRVPARSVVATESVTGLVSALKLETVCQSAKCPNLAECFSRGTATFMILGRTCTRNCRFCAVESGTPLPPDADEPERVALAVKRMQLDYVVVTSVTRDDLQDGGAGQFVSTIKSLREFCPGTRIEVLVPDFNENWQAVESVCRAEPDMFNHNLETVLRLSPLVRPQADYCRSLSVLTQAASRGLRVKSGLMLGLGESACEVKAALADLLHAGCSNVTIGQYLAPSREHIPVARQVTPDEFDYWTDYAKSLGFEGVVASPLVRSSYLADRFFDRHN